MMCNAWWLVLLLVMMVSWNLCAQYIMWSTCKFRLHITSPPIIITDVVVVVVIAYRLEALACLPCQLMSCVHSTNVIAYEIEWINSNDFNHTFYPCGVGNCVQTTDQNMSKFVLCQHAHTHTHVAT